MNYTDSWNALIDDTGERGTLMDCNTDPACPQNDGCSGEYRLTVNPTASGASDCGDFGTDVRAAVLGTYTSFRRTRPQAECVPGSGRFRLVPIQIGDRDGDGRFHANLYPVQVSGSGVLTSQAWVSSLGVVSNPGYSLRVVRSGQSYGFGAADELLDAPSVSLPVTGQHSFEQGVVGGAPPFVIEEALEGDLFGFEVDLSWTCGAAGTPVAGDLGYQLSLAAVGCDAVQKLTLRPHLSSPPRRIQWELYGAPVYEHVVPTQAVPDGDAFSVDLGRLSIDGAVLSANAQQARVRFDSMTWNGVGLCTPGTYTLAVE